MAPVPRAGRNPSLFSRPRHGLSVEFARKTNRCGNVYLNRAWRESADGAIPHRDPAAFGSAAYHVRRSAASQFGVRRATGHAAALPIDTRLQRTDHNPRAVHSAADLLRPAHVANTCGAIALFNSSGPIANGPTYTSPRNRQPAARF